MLKKSTSRWLQPLAIFVILSIWFMAIFSYTSPLYYFDISPDNNAFFTVGKAMMHGMVPYKDLFEQKGPFVYLIHGLASLITPHSLIGMFPVEVISLTVTIWFTYKILHLFLSSSISTMVAPFSAVLYLFHPYFNYGDTTESLLFPFLMYGLYLLIKDDQHTIKAGQRFRFSSKEWFILGLSVAIIFFSKYTQLGSWIVIYIVAFIYYLKYRDIKRLTKMVIWSLGGFLTGIVPWLFYFSLTGAFKAFWHVYFYENVTVYGDTKYPIISNLLQAINVYGGFLNANPLLFILGVVGIAYVLLSSTIFKTITGKLIFMLMMIGNVCLTVYGYTPSQAYSYYELFFMPYLVIPFIAVIVGVVRKTNPHFDENKLSLLTLGSFGLVFMLLLFVNNNVQSSRFFVNNSSITYVKDSVRHEPAQVVFGNIIRHETGSKTTLLNYGSIDMGFYTSSGVLPSEYYFENQNISEKTHPEIIDSQIDAIKHHRPEWVVFNTPYHINARKWNGVDNGNGKISNGNLNTGTQRIYPYLYRYYYPVKTHSQSFENTDVTYHLYRRRATPRKNIKIVVKKHHIIIVKIKHK